MRKTGPNLCGIGVPLACLIANCFGKDYGAFMLIENYLMASIFSLGAADAFRRASAKLMSTRKVMGSLLISILLTVLGCVGLGLWRSSWSALTLLYWLISCGMLVIVRCFEELFISQGDRFSAWLTDALSCIALTACLLIPMNELVQAEVVLIASAVLLVISGAIGLGFARKELPQLNRAVFKEIPAALLRTLLFPALWLAASVIATPHLLFDGSWSEGFYLPDYTLPAGLIFMELAKSTFRRDKFESAGLKIGVAVSELVLNAAIFAIFCFLPVYYTGPASAMAVLLLAGVCAMILYAPFDWESIAAALVMLAGSVLIIVGITPEYCSFPYEVFIGPAVGLILCILMLRQWAELFRARRANRIRKRAMKKSRS